MANIKNSTPKYPNPPLINGPIPHEAQMKHEDISEKTVTLTIKTLIVVTIFLITTVSGGVAAWMDLRSQSREIRMMQCDIRDLKNFMIFGTKPDLSKECK